ncbi:BAI1-associated protein 3-like isoform X3 [Octopus vulgaris]|uniref:BAI1-associated protein 3-like isoform X3 n=1 Tax=Octopus vulgaris TaxID=6645 RepID=A0AA36AY58_OCTVU|nr:BAI1-associated protein 3-like isoform X3 [Octopus vulgaris]
MFRSSRIQVMLDIGCDRVDRHEEAKKAEKPLPAEQQIALKLKLHQPTKQEYELLYIEVLYTIKHKIGTTIGGHLPYMQDLYQYAQDAFGMPPEDHAKLLAKATEEKPPILMLNVTVVQARDLEAKDADGYSDPFCMLGIMPSCPVDYSSSESTSSYPDDENPRYRDKKGLKKFSTSSLHKKKDKQQAVRDLLPAKLIRTTNVKKNTLNPVWNERFRFDLDDINADCLHLDIWDHDEEYSVFEAAKKLNEVSGFKGLGRFFKQVAQSARKGSSGSVDDFLGCVNIPAKEIPSSGLEKWYNLEGRSSKSNIQGEIQLKLCLTTREDRGIPEDDNWTDMKQHEDLICIFIEYRVRTLQDAPNKWAGKLPQAALTILHQHAIQGDVTDIQQAICYWAAFCRKHIEHTFDYALMYLQLERLDSVWEPGQLSSIEEESLIESFNLFIDYCLNLIRKQRDVFIPSQKDAMHSLECMLRCLSKIYGMTAFKELCPFAKELHSQIVTAIKKGTTDWYDRVAKRTKSKSKIEGDIIRSLIELTTLLNADMHQAVHFYQKLYEDIVGVEYVPLSYLHLEELLAQDVITALRDEVGDDLKIGNLEYEEVKYQVTSVASSEIGTSLFEFYLELQEFCKFKRLITETEQMSLSITKYYEWFRFAVQKWLIIAQQKATARVSKAVEVDTVYSNICNAKYSSSAVDVCSLFNHMVDFWTNLEWPEPCDAYTFTANLTQNICDNAVRYADLIHDKLCASGFYDEEGQFDVSEQLCITINNIEHVRITLKPIAQTMRFATLEQDLEYADPKRRRKLEKINLFTLVNKSDQMMINKIKRVLDRVADRMRPDIKKDVFHMNWTPDVVPADEAIVDLMEYLDKNLVTLNQNLVSANFNRILHSIWVEVLEEFNDVMVTEDMKHQVFYQRMYDALTLLLEFFYANNKGLSMDTMLTDKQFQDLREQLALHKEDTRDLIEQFYQEKLDEQDQTETSPYGILNIRVFYKYEVQTLLVEVISGKDLIPLDANGFSDPFILIHLSPEHIFPNITVQKTQIVKKTLNPVFDELFEFPVSPEQCKHRGAAIQFIVMDHDFMFQNDIGGEAYIPLSEIPGVNGAEVTGFEALNIISMPLMHPRHKEKGTFNVLRGRTWDKEAQEFVKRRIKLEEQAS